MDEKYCNSHNIICSRFTLQLTAQPTCRLPWTIHRGGEYVEMLHSLLRLYLNPMDGSALVGPTSTISLTYAANYDTAVKWTW